MTSELKALIESDGTGSVTIGNVRVSRLFNGVLSLMNSDSSLTQPELDQVRKALKEAGYVDYESWVATQGASWLNSGLFAGVSLRIKEVAS